MKKIFENFGFKGSVRWASTALAVLSVSIVLGAGNIASAVDVKDTAELNTELGTAVASKTINISPATGSGITLINNLVRQHVEDLTITGSGHYLDGGGTYSGFIVNDDAVGGTAKTLTIGEGLTFQNFVSNAKNSGSAIYNYASLTIGAATGKITIENNVKFSDNTANDNGGAIYNYSYTPSSSPATGILDIGDNVEFLRNTATNGHGGAIYNNARSTSGIATNTLTIGTGATFSGNTTGNLGGAIYNNALGSAGATNTLTIGTGATFSGNSAGNGGAIFNMAASDGNATNTLTIGDGATFSGNIADIGHGGAIYNYVESTSGIASSIINMGNNTTFSGNTAGSLGGAIYNYATGTGTTRSNINITTTGGTVLFTNNKDTNGNRLNDIYLGGTNAYLDIRGSLGKVIFESGIANENSDALINKTERNELVLGVSPERIAAGAVDTNNTARFDTFTGKFQQDAGTTTVYANNFFSGFNRIETSALNLFQSASTMGIGQLSLGDAHINSMNGVTTTYTIGSFSASGMYNDFSIDIDGAAGKYDQFDITNDVGASVVKNINIANINVFSVPTAETLDLNVFTGDILNYTFTSSNKECLTPIYKYHVESLDPDAGYAGADAAKGAYRLFRAPNNSFNPAIMASPVATTAGTYATQLNTFRESFNHMDRLMNMNRNARFALKNQNRVAIADNSTGTPFSLYANHDEGSMWYNPHISLERVNLEGADGSSVDNTTYGSYFGVDLKMKELKNGWSVVNSFLGGYIGAHQSFEGVGNYQNGVALGATSTFYKNDTFAGITASTGYMNNDASTMYGRDNFHTLNSGVAAKIGRNFEFKKLIMQPSMMAGYSFIKTFDYTTASGVNVESDPLHAIVLQPGIKLIANLESGWQPYIAASAVWNVMGKSKVRANDIYLPELSMKPYAQYGVGIQKAWNDRFSCFVQAMVRSGGRTGIDFSAGLNIAIGKDPKKNAL